MSVSEQPVINVIKLVGTFLQSEELKQFNILCLAMLRRTPNGSFNIINVRAWSRDIFQIFSRNEKVENR